MTLEFRDIEGKYLRQWFNMDVIPMIGDHVLLHGGYVDGKSDEYVVLWRVFDGLHTDFVVIVVEEVEL